MLGKLRRIYLAWTVGMVIPAFAVAQSDPPAFPGYTSDAPQWIAIVSKLTAEQIATLAKSIDAADLYGLFPADVQSKTADDYGIALYILASWEVVNDLPALTIPPFALRE